MLYKTSNHTNKQQWLKLYMTGFELLLPSAVNAEIPHLYAPVLIKSGNH
jgi:hypothetical protein